MNAKQHPSPSRNSQRGFALISSIIIMSLLMVVALAMISISSVESRSSAVNIHKMEAEANARMALMIALADLQKTAGPDQRVTAESSIIEPAESAGTLANRHWVGVWKSNALKGEDETTVQPIIHRNTESSDDNYGSLIDRRANESDYDAKDQAIAWLVSSLGNNPADPTVALDETTSALLVGESSTTNPLDYVRAAKVDVEKNGVVTGKYAYWVGDEGVKARYNMMTPSQGLAQRHPSLAPAQLGINILPEFVNYEKADDVNRVISRATTDNNLSVFASAEEAQKARKGHFHDLTFSSIGLPTDTQNGGVRKDIGVFLKEGTAADLGSRKGLELSTPLVDTDRLKNVTAKFGVIHSWNKLGENSDASTDPIPPENLANGTGWGWTSLEPWTFGSGINLSQQDKAPIHPIMIDVGISYGVSLSKAGPSTGGITPYRLNIHYFPRVVLWNPYNIKINAAKYLTQINMPHQFNVQILLPGEPMKNYRYFEAFHQRYGGENLPHRPHFPRFK